MKAFFRGIGLPTSLPELGITDDRMEEMARKATARGPLGNFVKLSKDDVVSIYRLAQ